jgi:hypothetical protein
MIFFVVQAIIVLLLFSNVWYSPVVYRLLMLFINIAISGIFGWRLYKQRYHLVFSYDEKGFTLKQGNREEISHNWSDFSKVSLISSEQGGFSIRLYDSDFFDLPTSKLKLDPFSFRLEATKLVEVSQKKKTR